MKKIFAILAIAGSLTACNNSSEGATTKDSTATDSTATMAPADSITVAPAVDSTVTKDSTAATDTTKK